MLSDLSASAVPAALVKNEQQCSDEILWGKNNSICGPPTKASLLYFPFEHREVTSGSHQRIKNTGTAPTRSQYTEKIKCVAMRTDGSSASLRYYRLRLIQKNMSL